MGERAERDGHRCHTGTSMPSQSADVLRIELTVGGMTCAACAARVRNG